MQHFSHICLDQETNLALQTIGKLCFIKCQSISHTRKKSVWSSCSNEVSLTPVGFQRRSAAKRKFPEKLGRSERSKESAKTGCVCVLVCVCVCVC
jgi:hypothetical protein